jgi:hypothetical protein
LRVLRLPTYGSKSPLTWIPLCVEPLAAIAMYAMSKASWQRISLS